MTTVMDLLTAGVVIADKDGLASFASSAWTAMTGQMEADWHGTGWLDVLEPARRGSARTALLDTIGRGGVYDGDWEVTPIGQPSRVLHVVAVPQRSAGLVPGFVATVVDVTTDREHIKYLTHLATHDPLTGLYNRTQFMEFVQHALDRMKRSSDRMAAVFFVDIDGFKGTNDEFGHVAGDRLLRGVAARIEGAVRPEDVVARYGGDEFTILCEDLREIGDAEAIATRIWTDAAWGGGDGEGCIVSVGFAVADGPDVDPRRLVEAADEAMYERKLCHPTNSEITPSRPGRQTWPRRDLRICSELPTQL